MNSIKVVSLLVLIALFPCLPGTASGESAAAPPVVVVMVPLSGDLAPMGEQLVESAKMAGRQADVTVESVDEGQSAGEVRRAMQALVERSDVTAIIGPIGRAHVPMAAQIAQAHGVPMIGYSPREGFEQRGAWVFRGRLGAVEQARSMVAYLAQEHPALESVGIMAPRTRYGTAFLVPLIEAVTEASMTVRALARYDDDTTDFGPVVEVLVGQRAYTAAQERAVAVSRPESIPFEALVIIDFHDVVARILPFLRRVGIRTGAGDRGTPVQLLGFSGWRGDGLARAGRYSQGAIFFDTFGGSVDGPKARQFSLDFEAYTGRTATTPEAEIYDLVRLVAEAVESAPDVQSMRRSLRDRLRGEQLFEGVTGEWRFEENGAPRRQLNTYHVVDDGSWIRRSGVRP